MKKYLLSLFLLCAVFLGHAQVVLNELYTDPGKNNSEFFELYNTSIEPNSINLNCYTLVVYYEANGKSGFYVLDLPNLSISPKSYFVGTSATTSTFSVQGTPGATANFSWNSSNLVAQGGSITRYELTANNTGYTVTNNFTTDNLFTTVNGQSIGGAKYAVFLFDNGTYINGFLGGYGSMIVPSQIRSMPAITGLTNSCGTYSINWSQVTTTESSGEAAGSDNGFARKGDGLCGVWDKTSNQVNHSPGRTNPRAGTSSSIGSLSTTQKLVCGNRIDFTITAPTTGTAYPVEVRLYIDNNKNGTLEVTDQYLQSYPSIISGGSNTVYSFTGLAVLPTTSQYLVVYKTALGCFDKLVVPTVATGSLTTTAKNVCGKQIDFTITGASGDASTYTLPIIVELHYDLDGDKILDENESAVIEQKEITSFSNTAYSFTNPDPTKQVILVYKTAQTCFDKSQFAEPTTGTLATTENYVCNNRLSFTVSGGTTSDATTYSLPVDVMVYNVATGELMGSKTVTTFSTLADYIDLIPADWNTTTVRVEYKSTNDCFSKIVSGPAKVPTGNITLKAALPTTTTVSYSIDNTTASDAYSFVITVYEDRNNNGRGDADEPVLNNHTINTAPPANTTFSATLQDTKYNAVVEAKSTVGCSQATLLLAPAKPLPVKLVSFTAKRNKEKVHLTWETSMEQNNSGFDIQRKVGNGEWKTIAFMFSQANGGNSNSVLRYEYNDVNPAKGVSQYRLRQVDIDTRSTLSEIRSVRGLEQASQSLVYPNPSTDGKVNIIFDDHSSRRTISISDLTGRVIKQYQNVVDNALLIDGLQDGIYTLQITNTTTGETSVQKVVIKKR